MSTQQTNFCRQIIKQFNDPFIQTPELQDNLKGAVLQTLRKAKLFVLPDGGVVHDDFEYRALDESEELHLPYKDIALEYFVPTDEHFPKRVLFASETESQIVLAPVVWFAERKQWAILALLALPKTGYLDRSVPKQNGRVAVMVILGQGWPKGTDIGEPRILLSMLNALQCSNVKIAKIKARKAAKKTTSAIAFDEYHVLTVENSSNNQIGSQGGSHRSPREHLRRGHIRRLETGRKIWVNAAIVGAGKGAGKITKDYLLMAAA